jgi:hypothetical protein
MTTNKPDLAQQAIDYLVQHDLMLRWEIPEADPPPPDIKRLVMRYLAEGEIELTTSELLANYLIGRLRDDCLPLDAPNRSAHDPASLSRIPSCRVVRDD